MIPLKEHLTNEELRERFENPFQLVNYAISLARVQAERGEELESNAAGQVLDMILEKQDLEENEENETT